MLKCSFVVWPAVQGVGVRHYLDNVILAPYNLELVVYTLFGLRHTPINQMLPRNRAPKFVHIKSPTIILVRCRIFLVFQLISRVLLVYFVYIAQGVLNKKLFDFVLFVVRQIHNLAEI